MAKTFQWFKENTETAIALLLATTVSILGIVDAVSVDIVSKAVPLTLAALAFALLRERWRRDDLDREVVTAIRQTVDKLDRVSERLDSLAPLAPLVRDVQGVLADISAVRLLTGDDISAALHHARQDAGLWMFKGGTGTFTRLITLPECIDNARRQRRPLRVFLEILDPTDFGLCERYANLYKSLADRPSDNETTWDGDGTRRELYATILAACWHRQRYRLLDINVDIGLSRTITTLRWDLSDRSLIVTQRGPRFPALMIDRTQIHYATWNTELRTSFRESRSLPLDSAEQVTLSDIPTPDEVHDVFIALGIELPSNYSEADHRDIVDKALDGTDPYPRGAGDRVATHSS